MVPANQGSRTALVTWTVVFAILFVTATVFAIYFYVDANKSETALRKVSDQYRSIITEGGLTGDTVGRFDQIRKAAAERPEGVPPTAVTDAMPLLEVAATTLDELERTTGFKSDIDAHRAVASMSTRFPATQPSESFIKPGESVQDVLNKIADRLDAESKRAASLQAQVDAARASEAKRDEARQAFASGKDALPGRKEVDQQLQRFATEGSTVLQSAADAGTASQEQVAKITADFQTQAAAAAESYQQAQTQIADLQRSNDQLKTEIQKMQSKITGTRVNASDAVVRQADGQIIRVAGGGVVYIGLGQGDQVSSGMTFQVYDKVTGIPSLADGDDQKLPRGKASLEVVRVGATSSECRVIRTYPGETITEGDLIANIVYDRNARYNFLVFGNFDLDQNSVATAQDTEVIKRMVTQWGGRLTDKVNVDTDFVVLGQEPQIPTFTREELEEPLNRERLNRATADANAFDEVRRMAQEYNIPILNQNRFLYFVGFYELSRR